MKLAKNITRQIVNLVAILAAFGTNIFANLAPPNGMTIGDIANTLFQDVLITPANYAFAIWGVIYLGLISLAIYQALPNQREKPQLQRLGYWLVIASVAQIIWIFLFLYRLFALSFLAMIVILVALIFAYLRSRDVSRPQKWLVRIPISIYTAWISVATVVNGATAFSARNWNGWGISPVGWTVIMLLVAAAVGAIVAWRHVDIAYGAVFIWALVAIAVRNLDILIVAVTAIGLAIALAAILFVRLLRPSQSSRTPIH